MGFSEQSSFKVNYNVVSDDDYFSDFGSDTSSTSQRYLQQFVDFKYRGRQQSLNVYVRNYQVLDPSIPSRFEPYKNLPQN